GRQNQPRDNENRHSAHSSGRIQEWRPTRNFNRWSMENRRPGGNLWAFDGFGDFWLSFPAIVFPFCREGQTNKPYAQDAGREWFFLVVDPLLY
ncbi:MAG: hypothetical protein OYH76_20995, partial [Defluviicoccus sp.]|nr:hypothetical protein [Defluviicoccus sp.]MDE0278381.1 hypothetical protein [Defluviicoccus sp.]